MTIDTTQLLQQLGALNWKDMAAGAVLARGVEFVLVAVVRAAPGILVRLVKWRVQNLAAARKLDGPTMKLLKAIAKAIFEWVDEELPDDPTPEQLQAVVDQLALVPILGVFVRADRDGARAILTEANKALNAEAKAQKLTLGGSTDGQAAPLPAPPPSPEPPSAPQP